MTQEAEVWSDWGGLCGCHWGPFEVHRLLTRWLSGGLERGLTLTEHLPCQALWRFTIHSLDEAQRGQCLAQGHTAREEVGRCAEPSQVLTGLPSVLGTTRPEWPEVSSKQRQLRGTLFAESCFVLRRSPVSGWEGGPGATDPGSQVTGSHHWGVQFPGGLSHLQPGSSQPRKTVTWGESWALQKRVWAREIIARAAPSGAVRARPSTPASWGPGLAQRKGQPSPHLLSILL